MKTSQVTMAVLLGVLMAFGASSYAQSVSGGGSGGAAAGGTSGGVAGSVGAGGLSGVTGPGGVTGTQSGIAGAVGSGPFGAGNVGFGGQNFGTSNDFRGRNFGPNASGFGTGRGFVTQQNRPGFNAPINPRFNRFNQRPLNQGNSSFNQGQGSFQNGQGSFSQGMQNQGAFGLGNGNRSSFFDNQPFNNQGFGRGAGAVSGANSSSDFTEAGDPEGFAGTDADFDDGTQTFDDGDFTDADSNGSDFQEDAFTPDSNTRFDDANDQSSFRGEQFGDDESTDAESLEPDRNAVPPFGPGLDHAFRDPSDPIGFHGAATPRVRRGGAATAPGLEHAFRDPSDPIGFHGAASARARSIENNPASADRSGDAQPAVDAGPRTELDDSSSLDDRNFNSTGASANQFNDNMDDTPGGSTLGATNPGQSLGTLPNAGTTDEGTSTVPAAGAVPTGTTADGTGDINDPNWPGRYFNRPEGSQPGIGLYGPDSQLDSRTSGGAAGGVGAGVGGGNGEITPPNFPPRYFNRPEGSQPGIGLYRPGGYGFMNQYSNQRAAQAQSRSGGQEGTLNRSPAPGPSGRTPPRSDQGTRTPNYFNGAYSRSRL